VCDTSVIGNTATWEVVINNTGRLPIIGLQATSQLIEPAFGFPNGCEYYLANQEFTNVALGAPVSTANPLPSGHVATMLDHRICLTQNGVFRVAITATFSDNSTMSLGDTMSDTLLPQVVSHSVTPSNSSEWKAFNSGGAINYNGSYILGIWASNYGTVPIIRVSAVVNVISAFTTCQAGCLATVNTTQFYSGSSLVTSPSPLVSGRTGVFSYVLQSKYALGAALNATITVDYADGSVSTQTIEIPGVAP